MNTTKPAPFVFTAYQKFVVALLAFLQFTLILDFMIISPLGAILMQSLNITPKQFGFVVSAYALSAGASGILAAGFADRFDRKKLLMFFYGGFVLGTLFCGLAPTYEFLLAARMVTGIFGGVIGAICLAIVTDLFPYQARGRVMGIMQSAFAGSQILGIPIGLYISNLWGWHAPFLMIVAISLIAGIFMVIYLKPLKGHLDSKTDKNAFLHLWHTLKNGRFQLAFVTTGLLSLGGFMLMPFGSDFTVHNLGISMEQLPLIYLVSGLAAMVIAPAVGRASDAFGKFKVFIAGCILSLIMVLIYTHLSVTPLIGVMTVNILLFVGIFSRMIPSQALMTALPDTHNRGAFMAVSSSLQQIAGGIAAIGAGYIVKKSSSGALEHFDVLGYILNATVLITAYTMYVIHKSVNEKTN